jgi:hypothetical protein
LTVLDERTKGTDSPKEIGSADLPRARSSLLNTSSSGRFNALTSRKGDE